MTDYENAKAKYEEAKRATSEAKKNESLALDELIKEFESINGLERGNTRIINKKGVEFIFDRVDTLFFDSASIKVFKLKKDGKPYKDSTYGYLLSDYEIVQGEK